MPKERVSDAQVSFIGGLNTAADIPQLKANEIRAAQNARLTDFGGVLKRGGLQRTHSAALNAATIVRNGYGWVRGTNVQQLAMCNGQLFTGTYGIPMTWTGQAGAFDAAVYPSFVGFTDGTNDVAYIADGGLLNKWDGTNVTINIAGTPAVSQIAVYNLRLFGISGSNSTLYWSPLGLGDDLGDVAAGGGLAIIKTYAQQDLIGLLPLGGSLMLIHRNGISRFTGWSQDDIDIDAGTQGVSADTGTVAPRSLVAVENVGYMVSDRGVYEITEFGVRNISKKIEDLFRSLDHSSFSRIIGAHHKTRMEVHFYFPDVGVYVYNYDIQQWSGPFTGAYIDPVTHAMWPTVDGNSVPIVLTGGADGFVRRVDSPSVYKDDVLSDGTAGTTYPMVVQCHRMFFGDAEMEKSLRFFYIMANAVAGQTASASWQMEGVTASHDIPQGIATVVWGVGVWGVGVWPQTVNTQPRRLQAHGHGTFLDLTLTDDSEAAVVYSRVRAEGFLTGMRY